MSKSILFKSLAGLAVAYCLLLLLAGPLVLKPVIIKQAKKNIHGSLQLESLWINPFTLSISLKNLSVSNKEDQALATAKRIYINVDILPLVLMNAHIKTFQVEQLRLLTAQESPDAWLHLTQLTATQLDAALLKNTVNVEDILLNELSIKPTLYKNKTNNLENFEKEIKQLFIKPVDAENKEEKQDWLLSIQSVQINNSDLLIRDHRLASEKADKADKADKATSQLISNINVNMQSIYSDYSKDILFSLKMEALNGELEFKGHVSPDNLTSELDYTLKEIQLEQLNTYVEHYSLASLESGLLYSSGTVSTHEANSQTQQPANDQQAQNILVKIINKTKIENLIVGHQQFEEALLSCQLLDSGTFNIDFDTNSELEQLNLDTLLIDQCQFYVVLLKDGSNNLSLEKPESKNKAETKENTQASTQEAEQNEKKSLPIHIGEIRLKQSSIQIKNVTRGAPVEINISDLSLLLSDIAEGSIDQTKIELSAKINDHAPLSLKGTANFINPQISANTHLQLTRLGLSTFSPYTLALSNRPIEKGVLSLTIETHILKNQLDSNNKIFIEGIKMGKHESYPDAGNLPLALAITVLRDSNGNLNIDIPIQGDLDDPGFSIRKQVISSLSGMINKAALAPLNMIGGLISRDNTQARIIVFEQQSSTLDDAAVKQADKIADTLIKNPELALSFAAILSENEAQNLSEQQKADLLTSRIDAFEKELINSGLTANQIDKAPLDIDNVKQQGGLEIQFFAR